MVEWESSHLGVRGAHGHGLRNLLVDDDIDFDALLGLAFQDSVETPLGVRSRRAAKIQLRSEPPVLEGIRLVIRTA
jgi:hypothetical protein